MFWMRTWAFHRASLLPAAPLSVATLARRHFLFTLNYSFRRATRPPYSLLGYTPRRTFLGRGDKQDNFYSVLNVSKKASQEDLKKAYFALAKKYHPDVNTSPEAKERFAKISAAYETLSNPEKRRVYDATGMNKDEQDTAKEQGFDFSSFGQGWGWGDDDGSTVTPEKMEKANKKYDSFFGMFSGASKSTRTTSTAPPPSRGRDATTKLEIEFLESVIGTTKQVNFARDAVCTSCNGKRTQAGNDSKESRSDKGGSSDQCLSCRGRGLLYQPAREEARIPPGVESGSVLRMRGRGGRTIGKGENGDLLIEVSVKSDPKFQRDGLNLHSEQEITLSQALLGGNVVIDMVEG